MSSTCPICEGAHLASTCPWPVEESAWTPDAVTAEGPEEADEQGLRRAIGARGIAPLANLARACEREVEVLETVDRDADQRARITRSRKLIQAVRDLRGGRLEGAGRSLAEAEQALPGDGWTALVRGYWALAGDRDGEATGAFARAAESGGEHAFAAEAGLMAGRCALAAGNPEVARAHLERARSEGASASDTEITYQLARTTADPEVLLAAARPEPWLLGRARADGLLSMIEAPLGEVERRQAQQSAEIWHAIHERVTSARERCDRWLALTEGRFHDRSLALQAQREAAEARAARPDPFAGQEAAERAESLPVDLDELAREARAQVTAEMRGRVAELARAVEEAEPGLKATREWSAAEAAARDLGEKLEDVEQLGDEQARTVLDEARHEAGVHKELLEVTGEEVEAREQAVSEDRTFRHRADYAVMAEVRGRMASIHWLLAGGAAAALLLVWTGPGILLAVIPAALALLRAATGRAILRQRVWSIPRGEADELAGELMTRVIVAVLLIVAMAAGMVIRWMVLSLG